LRNFQLTADAVLSTPRDSSYDLSVIIVNWNTAALLEQCVASIVETNSGLTVEVIVVDNASTDDSVDLVQTRFPDVIVLVNEQNLGFSRSANRALRQCR
jgi:GT2 family glycosyltransferase